MARSSLLGIDGSGATAPGRDTPSLGPGDTSDSGSDVAGLDERDDEDPGLLADTATDADSERSGAGAESYAPGADTDATGTGERRSAAGDAGEPDGSDIGVDRIVDDPESFEATESELDACVQRELANEPDESYTEEEADEDTEAAPGVDDSASPKRRP